MLEASYATVDDIDHAMKLGCGYPVGPFELLDSIGPETVLSGLRALHRETPEPGLAPAPLLEQLVTAGRGFRT
jgi:3-hydroxybutyryl-CoA dehydrogenase